MSEVQEFHRAPRLLGDLVPRTVGYAATGLEQRIHRGLPSPYLTVIFSFDGPVVTGESPEHAYGPTPWRHQVLVGGLATRSAYVVQPQHQAGIQLAVHPLAARAILGPPAAELTQLAGDGTDVLGPGAAELCDRLHSAASWADRFALVRDYVRGRVDDRRLGHPRPELVAAWTWLARSRGTGSMTGLARHVHLSERQLRTLFQREVGLGPKQVARLMRFDHAKRRLAGSAAAGASLDLATVAVECGYYDHSHLDRDFAALVGTGPRAWLAEERRNIQAGGHGVEAGSRA